MTELEDLKRLASRVGVRQVVLDLPRTDAAIAPTERVINARLRSCGCGTGALFVATGILLLGIRLALGHPPRVWTAIGLLFALAIAGKLIGIAVSEWKLRIAVDRLAAKLTELAVPSGGSSVGSA